MVKQSPHKRWKGHCLWCSSGHAGSPHNSVDSRRGDTERTPFKVLRKLGVSRRYSRNKAYGDD